MPRISVSTLEAVNGFRRNEPVTVGIPFPKAWCHDVADLSLVSADGVPAVLQARPLDRWSDRSVRWALLDFAASVSNLGSTYRLEPRAALPPAHSVGVRVDVAERQASVVLPTGRFELRSNGELAYRHAGDMNRPEIVAAFRLTGPGGSSLPIHIDRVTCGEPGPQRVSLLVAATIHLGDGAPVRLSVRYHFYAGTSAVRIQPTLHNPRRARHENGFWDLGDPASRYFEDFSLAVVIPKTDGPVVVACSPERGLPLVPCDVPFELHQESSGGEHWQSSTHVNSEGRVPVRFRGYQISAGNRRTEGLRSTPILAARAGHSVVTIAQRYFWERFPKALSVNDSILRLHLLPGQCGDRHELQGGEQVSDDFVVCFDEDGISETPLEWVRNPSIAHADVAWYRAADAAPYLTPIDTAAGRLHVTLAQAAIDGEHTVYAKREQIDEYGWRNFGDLYGDHETVFHKGSTPLISHYNNQYDAIAGFAHQFFRTVDPRWAVVMDQLARHVIDIDIYHTNEDKSAYNEGLFWHTAHHTDADRATHRTYPRAAGAASGGPSPEHNYNTGLMQYYLLTGDERARDAVIGLARWVIDMDDGTKTPFRWLSHARTGLASASGSWHYHGPGRAPGNSVTALLNACRVSGDRTYLLKAEELIRRCIHPFDDIPARELLDAERRWYYTIFLQALGKYLDFKSERAELDQMHAYTRAALLHYARWMAVNEYPYLDKPENLEFVTETWAAQDIRKSDVFALAAKYATGDERTRFIERSTFFFEYSVSALATRETRTYTRPVVLMLTNGYAHSLVYNLPDPPAAVADDPDAFGAPVRFMPQRLVALRRLIAIATVGGLVTVSALVWWLI